MKHPMILLVPVLMLVDYYLTLAGAALQRRRLGGAPGKSSYELNPVWQESVAQRRWFNPRHLLAVALTSGLLVFLLEFGSLPDPLGEALLAGLFVAEGMLIGRHVSNILTYRRMARSRGEVAGEVRMSHAVTLCVSAYQYLVAAVPLVFLAALDRTPAALGGVVGAVAMFLVHGLWIWRHKRALTRSAPPSKSASA